MVDGRACEVAAAALCDGGRDGDAVALDDGSRDACRCRQRHKRDLRIEAASLHEVDVVYPARAGIGVVGGQGDVQVVGCYTEL